MSIIKYLNYGAEEEGAIKIINVYVKNKRKGILGLQYVIDSLVIP